MSLPITDEVSAHVGPDLRGVLLGLVEAWQGQKRWEDATACLERLRRLEPDDVVGQEHGVKRAVGTTMSQYTLCCTRHQP